tara:strand:+ start:15354 stop:16292 length:939 start_codon:yes stop_codon:yes gene_type:complete
MEGSTKKLYFFSGLSLVKYQWKMLLLAFLASTIILSLDFILTISMPLIIEGIQKQIDQDNIFELPTSLIFLIILIIFRPLIGWTINFFQINIILLILRDLDEKIAIRSSEIYKNNPDNFSSENSANMLISHGRYFVDAYLIPFIRAITDFGSVVVISIGLFIQFPIPLLIFAFSVTLLIGIYQIITGKILKRNGELILLSYENIISSSSEGHTKSSINIKNALDLKRSSSLAMGSISQGLKYVIEFCFMFAFGISLVYMIIFSQDIISAFVSTFAYAGIRMLPSFTSITAFIQGKSTAEHAINELSNHLYNK